MASERPVVFLDRDGTLNKKAPEGEYVRSWAEFEWLPDARSALALLSRAGCRLVVVTNQRGIALGRMSEGAVRDIHMRLRADASAAGGQIAAVYHCPHESGTCDCRKPADGMLRRACRELGPGIPTYGAIVGDSITDLLAGDSLGLIKLLLRADEVIPPFEADHVAPSLLPAAEWLLARWGLGR